MATAPAGITRGTGPAYGTFYYNGTRITGASGDTVFLPDGSTQNVPGFNDYFNAPDTTAAVNAGYAADEQQRGIAQSVGTPMNAVLTDPEWQALSSKPAGSWHFNDLSAGLQAKIAKVPALYAQLTGDQAAWDKIFAEQQAKDEAAKAAQDAAARANPVYRINGQDVTGDAAQKVQTAIDTTVQTGDRSTLDQTIAEVAPPKQQISPRIPVAPPTDIGGMIPANVPVLKTDDSQPAGDALNVNRPADSGDGSTSFAGGYSPSYSGTPTNAATPAPAAATAAPSSNAHWIGIALAILLLLMIVFHFAR